MSKHRIILNAGSLAGLTTYALFVIYYHVFGLNPFGAIKLLSLVAPVYFMRKGLLTYRETELEGFARFGQLFNAGIIFSFIYASLSGMLVYFHGLFVDAGWVDLLVNESLQMYEDFKTFIVRYQGEEFYNELIEKVNSSSISNLAIGDFMSKSYTALLIALIMSITLRKKPPIFGNSEQ